MTPPRRQLFILATVKAVRSCADSSPHVFRRRHFGDLFARLYHRTMSGKRSHTRPSSSCRLDLTFLSGLCVVEKRRTRPGQPRPIRSDGLARCVSLSSTPENPSRPTVMLGWALWASCSDQLARLGPAAVLLQPWSQAPSRQFSRLFLNF